MRRILLAAPLFAACAELGLEPAGLPPPPRPVLRESLKISPVFGTSLIARRRVDGLKAEFMIVGRGQVRGSYLSEFKSPEAKLRPPVMVVLIRHPKEGPILFGAGLPEELGRLGASRVRGAALAPFKIEKDQDLLSQLDKKGVKPEEVKWVILPDLAPEWAGRAGAFPGATVVLSKEAWERPRRRQLESKLTDPRAFIPEERLKLIDFSDKPQYGPFAHGADLLEDGTLVVVDLEGGAAGGLGLWVNLDSGPMLLTGPAAFVYDNIHDSALPDRKFVVDISSFAWNARAMRQALESVPRLTVVPAHDPGVLRLSPRPDITAP